MRETGKTIAKNASYLMFSQAITWALTLLLTVILTRYLGPAGSGKFHLANSLWAMIIVTATFGMDVLLTKEIAREPQKASALFSVSAVLRLVLFGLGFIVVTIYAKLVSYPQETLQVIYIIGLANYIGQISNTCRACLQGLELMKYTSLANIISKLALTFINVVLVLMGKGLIAIALVDIIVEIISLLLLFNYLSRSQQLRFQFDRSLAQWMLKASFPYLLVALFLVIYNNVDMIIISLLVDETAIGWYGAVDKLFGTLLFVPTVFITAIFPAVSRMYVETPDSLPRLIDKSFNLLLIIGVAVGLGIFLVANQVVVLIFGEDFANSGPILAVIGFVVIFTYQNALIGQYMLAMDRQKYWVWVMAIATIATVPLDIIFVPLCQQLFQNGAMGGAFSFLVTELAMLLIGLKLMPKGMMGGQTAKVAFRVGLAGCLMVASVWWIRDLFIVIPIAVGAIAYLAGIFLFRALSLEDIAMVRELGQSIFARLRRQRTSATP